ncbi:MAG TPA: hypothetical protein VJN94_05260, partial [Candidatus Binataceae bacterium]|nr:hypothetical protein [Candidatus Binataceae bacterium]
MNFDRLLAPGVNQCAALVLSQIVRRSLQPGCVTIFLLRPLLRPGPQQSRQVAERGGDLAGLH